jgi:adenylate cyclase
MRIQIPKISFILSRLKHAPVSITLFWTTVICSAWFFSFPVLFQYELLSINHRFHWRGPEPAHPDVLIIGIDNNSMMSASGFDEAFFKENPDMALMRNWPFPRRLHGKLLDKLANAGARAVVFDLLFTSPSNPVDDKAFADSIRKNSNVVVLGANFTNDRELDAQLQLPENSLIPDNADPKQIVGLVNYCYDFDNQIRFAIAEFDVLNESYFSIDGLAVRKAHPEIPLPKRGLPCFINFSGPADTYPIIDFYKIFDPKHQSGKIPFYRGAPKTGWEIFKDKIVLVGPKGNFQHDNHPTPFGDNSFEYSFRKFSEANDIGEDATFLDKFISKTVRQRMPGVEIHANVIGTLLSGDEIKELPHGNALWVILFSGILYAFLLQKPQTVWMKLLPMVLFSIFYGVFCLVMFIKLHWIIPLVPVESIVIFSTMGTILFQATVDQLEKRRVSGMLQRYVSKNVADELIKSGQDVGSMMAPQKRTVTILFSDVRDFTTMTEQSEPGPFVQQLNEYLTAMVECVFNNHGTLDKFVGDAVMAVFGNPKSFGKEQDAWYAVKTAIEMRQRLALLNSKWEKEGRPIFKIGIGLNHGEVMAGDIGSSQKAEFGVIGDSVNVAARVESLTKEQKVDLLITDSVYQLVKDKVIVEHRGDIKVKGRGKAVDVYALKDLIDTKSSSVVMLRKAMAYSAPVTDKKLEA